MREGGGGGVTGTQSMSAAVYTGAQINFGDLISYLIYVCMCSVDMYRVADYYTM